MQLISAIPTRRSFGAANQERLLCEKDGNSTAELGCPLLTAASLHVHLSLIFRYLAGSTDKLLP